MAVTFSPPGTLPGYESWISPPQDPTPIHSHSKISCTKIIIVVAVLFFFLLVAGAIVFFVRRNRRRDASGAPTAPAIKLPNFKM